jgi:hypothetical protein
LPQRVIEGLSLGHDACLIAIAIRRKMLVLVFVPPVRYM